MKLWRRAAGALKDKNSIWIASVARRTSYRHPDLEAAIIKATSHDELYMDYRNAQRVFKWLRASPAYLKPLVWVLSRRMQKTRSWVVALKGLMLMHGVFCSKIPAVQKIERLPFDLSNFIDGHSKPAKTWGYSAFVRVYFAFLDQRAAFLCMDNSEEGQKDEGKQTEEPMVKELLKLQKWQTLLDMLLQIKPHAEGMNWGLILEAMDCIIIEIFDVYSRICDGIARVLVRIYAAGKVEAGMALKILKKATKQGEKLSQYFEFCKDIGVLNASEFPKVEQIPEEDIRDLERIINGVSERTNNADVGVSQKDEETDKDKDKAMVVVTENRAIDERNEPGRVLKTVITDKWEVFDDDFKVIEGIDHFSHVGGTTVRGDPWALALAASWNIQPHVRGYNEALPDLISF